MCLGYESTKVSESLMAWTVTPPLANIVKRLREILKPGIRQKGREVIYPFSIILEHCLTSPPKSM